MDKTMLGALKALTDQVRSAVEPGKAQVQIPPDQIKISDIIDAATEARDTLRLSHA